MPVDWKMEHDAERGLRQEFSARAYAAEAKVRRLREGIAAVVDTFARDEAQGYRSKDRQFAIEVLRPLISEIDERPEPIAPCDDAEFGMTP